LNYTISENTKAKLEEIIQDGPGQSWGHGGAGGVRQAVHVRITGCKDATTGLFPCKPCTYNPKDATWTDHADAWAFEPNTGKLLINGQRYLAVRYQGNRTLIPSKTCEKLQQDCFIPARGESFHAQAA
jgi:hypothetical protein